MTAFGVISNRASTGNREGLARIRRVLADHPSVAHAVTDGPEELDAGLRRLAEAGSQVLVLNGGDGTVQAVLTRLHTHSPFRHMPALAVLRAGNTSMIAADCGLPGPPHRALARLLRRQRETVAVERPLVGMQLTPEHPPVYGMFFGTAAITRAVHLTRRSLHPLGMTGAVGPTVALGLLLLRLLAGRTDETILRPERIAVGFDGEVEQAREHLIFLATTLERLFIGLRPYWGSGDGGLRCTGVLHRHRRLWRALPSLLRGSPSRHLCEQNGYYSRNAERVAVRMTCSFTLDGELFQPRPDRPVLLSAERRATFVTW